MSKFSFKKKDSELERFARKIIEKEIRERMIKVAKEAFKEKIEQFKKENNNV